MQVLLVLPEVVFLYSSRGRTELYPDHPQKSSSRDDVGCLRSTLAGAILTGMSTSPKGYLEVFFGGGDSIPSKAILRHRRGGGYP